MNRKTEELENTEITKISPDASSETSENKEDEEKKKRLLIIIIILLLLLLLGGGLGWWLYKNHLAKQTPQPQPVEIVEVAEEPEPVLYSLNVDGDLKGGRLVFSKTQAYAGETIYVEIVADEGKVYKDKSLVLRVNGKEILVKNGEFLMPEGDIYAFAVFENSLAGIYVDPASYLHGWVELKKDDDDTVHINLTPHRGYQFEELAVTDEAFEGGGRHFTFVKNNERDVTILVTWQTVEYSLTYDLGGGDFIGQNEDEVLQNYTISSMAYDLPLAERTGYNFMGWVEKSSPKKARTTIAAKTTGNLQFTALWQPVSYQISYNNLEDSAIAKISSYTIEDFFTLPNAYRRGYDFTGWFMTSEALDETDTIPITAVASGSTGALDLYARWMPKEYSVVYNLNGGEYLDNTHVLKNYTISADEYALPLPVKNGYDFIGWALNDSPSKVKENFAGSAKVKKYFAIEPNTAENLNYMACWQPVDYKISLYDENGKKAFDDYSYNIEKSVKLPELTKKGYVFTGWSEGFEKNAPAFNELQKGNFGDKKLYAKFKPVDYTVTMHLYGSALNEYSQKFLYNRETEDFLLPVPYREGWDFAGWYADPERQNADVALIKQGSEGNRDFYADWSCTLSFDSTGGEECENITLSSKKPFVSDLPVTSRDYYDFDGWFYDKDCTQAFNSKNALKGNTTLYANWQPVYFSIQYQANGGEMPSTYLRQYTVESVQNSLPVPQREGWAFGGWYADSGFKTPIATAFATEQVQSKDLFARKMKDSASVISPFEGNGGFSPSRTNNSNLSALYAMDSLYEINEPVHVKVDLSSDITLFAKWFKFNTKIIPKGKYMRSDKSPSVENVPHDLEVSTTEITRNVYYTVMGVDPSDNNYSTFSTEEEKMENPVQMVSWFDALVFCNKLSMLNGVQPVYKIKGSTNPADWGNVPINNDLDWLAVEWDRNANGFRLPTEQEWMWAAMSGPLVSVDLDQNGVNTQGWKKKFAGQDLEEAKASSKLIKNYAWFSNNAKSKTHPAGLTLANEAGLVDMSGNVWEWCWDAFALYGDEDSDAEGSGNNVGEAYRSIRGGSWYSFPSYMRVNARLSLNVYGRNQLTGFRVVRTVNKTAP